MEMDFSNKLIIKARLGDDVRKIPVHTEDMSMDDLVLMMQRVFSHKISPSDDVTLKYTDEDGDLITLADYSDLHYAIHSSKILKLTLLVNNENFIDPVSASKLKEDLQDIRDKADQLILRLQKTATFRDGSGDGPAQNSQSGNQAKQQPPPPDVLNQGREFDPLQGQQRAAPVKDEPAQHNHVYNGTSNSRPETPASSVSLSSAANKQQGHQHQGFLQHGLDESGREEAPDPENSFTPVAPEPPRHYAQQQQPERPPSTASLPHQQYQPQPPVSSAPASQYFPQAGGQQQGHPPPPGPMMQQQHMPPMAQPRPVVPPPTSLAGGEPPNQNMGMRPQPPQMGGGPQGGMMPPQPMPPQGGPQHGFGNAVTGGFQPPPQQQGGQFGGPGGPGGPPGVPPMSYPPQGGPPSTPGIPTPGRGTPVMPPQQQQHQPPQQQQFGGQPPQPPSSQSGYYGGPPQGGQQQQPPSQGGQQMPPMGPPPMGPPPVMSSLPPGANPFARGQGQPTQYVRPAY